MQREDIESNQTREAGEESVREKEKDKEINRYEDSGIKRKRRKRDGEREAERH